MLNKWIALEKKNQLEKRNSFLESLERLHGSVFFEKTHLEVCVNVDCPN